MGFSVIELQREAILRAIRNVGRGQWKILILDTGSQRLINNVVKEDEILSEKITTIEQIEQRRETEREMDAIYLLSPEPNIVDCFLADMDRRRYRSAALLWTSLLHASQRKRIDEHRAAREQLTHYQVLDIGYYPRESQVITFRDPWSFPVLFHPQCNDLVRQHIADISQRIVAVCVSLGEYPIIRFYRPRANTHEASVLCTHLARFVQEEIDMYAQYHPDFPPASNRPRAVLYILDRSMDLMAPLVHDFTYQAMVHDLLPVRDGDKVTYRLTPSGDEANAEPKDAELTEKDKLWVENRHRHMKDTIDKLMGDFQKFIDANPHFANKDGNAGNSLGAIKDMLAGLPQFQEMKEAYSLHLTMAQDAMNVFQARKLPDLAAVEQSLATGFDEDHKKPKGLAEQVVRLLDEEGVVPSDRLRLILLYILYRDGVLASDVERLVQHAQLAAADSQVAKNLGQLGARVTRPLKDTKAPGEPLFERKPSNVSPQEEYSLSRFEPNLKLLLRQHVANTLSQEVFPPTKPQLDAPETGDNMAAASLRSAKPTWARTRSALSEPRQRVIVFMAGGATYSEARTCYEISEEHNRDVFLLTSHMIHPGLFLRQVGDLSVDRRQLRIPMEQPKPQAPAHLFEAESTKPAAVTAAAGAADAQRAPAAPTMQMGQMSLNRGPPAPTPPPALHANGSSSIEQQQQQAAPKKKKLGLFSSKR